MLRKIDRLILRVPSVSSAVKYYRDTLGLKLLRQDVRAAALLLADGSTELVLHADPDQPYEQLYYLVDDVRDLYARRLTLGLKFVSVPAPAARGYRAAVKDPFGNLLLILDRSTDSASASVVETAGGPSALFPGVAEPPPPPKPELLVKAYEEVGRTADDLPYTPEFERLYSIYRSQLPVPQPTRGEVWRQLLNLRKSRKLPRLGEARSAAPEVSADARKQLREVLGKDIGKRDRLPYTQRFDQIVDEFNRSERRKLSPHLVWRLVATLAK